MKKIDFYFDFGSPYSYLAHTQIKKFEKETGEKVSSPSPGILILPSLA